MIEVRGITKKFGEKKAVDDVSFEVKKGEVVGFLGPNGAGKTTTMRVITGFLAADGGEVVVGDTNIAADPLKAKAEIGYLPENSPLYPDMEVTDYLRYIATLRGVTDRPIDDAIRDVVATCGLKDVVGSTIATLSKGYKQRVGLAGALIHNPPILILDEPTSGLDPNQIVEIRNLIKDLGKERTVLLSTHILQEVEATCDRAIIINDGKIVGIGKINELLASRNVSQRYFISIKGDMPKVREGLCKFDSVNVLRAETDMDGAHHFSLSVAGERDFGEEFFKWAVANGFVLTELHREKASLEDVFKELTK